MDIEQLTAALTDANPWWRDPRGWAEDDPQLRQAAASSFGYEPDCLAQIEPDGLFILYGPRRVGKSVLVKQRIKRLIDDGCDPRRITYFSCEGLDADDLRTLHRIAGRLLVKTADEPRYWFLDEVTEVPGWPAAVKWLRDQTLLREDCVVLTGSSARDLAEARKQLAGRRGRAARPEVALLPMDFPAFYRATRSELPTGLPNLSPVELLGKQARDAIDTLLPWLPDLNLAWEEYLRIGGFPRAVSDYLSTSQVSDEFLRSLWDVAHGDALRRSQFSPQQTVMMLHRISRSLSSRINLTRMAREIGVGSHNTASERIVDLTRALITWPCHKEGDHGLPALKAQSKLYFSDPVYAALAAWRQPHLTPPDSAALTEQQVGLALLRHMPEPAGSPDAYDRPMFTIVGKREIDFVAPEMTGFGIEVKYTDRVTRTDSAPLRSRFGRGIIASRTALDLDSEVIVMPAGALGLLLG